MSDWEAEAPDDHKRDQQVQQPVEPSTNRGYRDDLISYYSEVGPDYASWSAKHHMHFGFYRRGMNPMRLEPMLEQMGREVLNRLELSDGPRLLDAGCGLGSVARQCVTTLENCRVVGVNIVPWAIEEAERLGAASGTGQAIDYVCCDYARLPFGDSQFDGAYAIESACHAPQHDLARLLSGLYRVLKPGRRAVFADGFLRSPDPLPRWLIPLYRRFCDGWALERLSKLPTFLLALRHVGFSDIRVEDISWRIMPSAAFIPIAASRMLRQRLKEAESRLTRRQWAHLTAPFAIPAFAAFPHRFGYFLITAKKPG